MRNVPGLAQDILDRATSLSASARLRADGLRALRPAPGGQSSPRNDMTPPAVVDGVAKLRLYDVIDPDGGYWGLSANEFTDALAQLPDDVSAIELHINSPGGSVWDGLTILNNLRQHDAPVTAVVDGVAASAASFIAVASDEVVMMPNSRMMIHDALGICLGQAQDMHDYGDFLADSSDNIAAIYASKAGGTVAEWRQTMQAKGLMGQWYSAEDAVAAGLADRVGLEQADDAAEEPAAKMPEQAAAALAETATVAAEQKAARLRAQERRHRMNARKIGA